MAVNEAKLARTRANKARRIEAEKNRQARYSGTAELRRILRKRGALNRIQRRINTTTAPAELARLGEIRQRVAAAYERSR